MMNRLIDTWTAKGDEVTVGYRIGAMTILAIDYVNNRILFNHYGLLKEFKSQTRLVFKEY